MAPSRLLRQEKTDSKVTPKVVVVLWWGGAVSGAGVWKGKEPCSCTTLPKGRHYHTGNLNRWRPSRAISGAQADSLSLHLGSYNPVHGHVTNTPNTSRALGPALRL